MKQRFFFFAVPLLILPLAAVSFQTPRQASPPPVIDASSYPDYDRLSDDLESLAAAFPRLTRLKSMGRSLQGRELWVMEVTDFESGPPESKPAIYLDGNMHASELVGSVICLKTIDTLAHGFSTDPETRRLLGDVVFYIFPRVSPDGAEYVLKTPYWVRSVLRPFPFTEERPGLYPEDLDGDGDVVEMRVPNPEGRWRISKLDARLMMPRGEGDDAGPFFDVYPEGLVRNYGGGPILLAPPRYGLDLNRNFPADWSPYQPGSGPFPLSEPESRAIADMVRLHPNIGIRVCYHTAVGTINRPYNTRPDADMPAPDLAAYKLLGEIGKSLTGYPMVSVYEEFGTRNAPLHGTSLEWHYQWMGLFSFVFESWNVEKKAGLGGYERKIPYHRETGRRRARSEEESVRILKWADREIGREAFKTWESFPHPQLGEVEIGGWHKKFSLINPPPAMLAAEVANDMTFAVEIAKRLPRVRVLDTRVERGAGDEYLVTAEIVNSGFFPTFITERAIQLGKAKSVEAELVIESGGELLNPAKMDLGHLEGTWSPDSPTEKLSPKPVSWRVKISDPGAFRAVVKAVSEKGGSHRMEVRLLK